MAALTVVARSGGLVDIAAESLEALGAGLRGEIVTPDCETYDEVRSIWNAMVDRHPGLIVRCHGAADVRRAVSFARDAGLLMSVRSGGHHIAGNSVCEGGLMVDLSPMTSVRVDRDRRSVRVEPGARLGDLDAETQAVGLAVPVGINSTTGIAGLTLGGGFGWLSRKHGMTIDNLLSADLVTADGEIVTTSAESHPDLFWAIRGGGGNFGIVTSFEFRAHEVGPEVLAGLVVHPFAQAKAAIEFYREFAAGASDDLTVWVVLRKAPPLPFLPEEVHGTEVCVFALVHTGEVETANQDVRRLRVWGTPVGEHVGRVPFVAFQQAFDPLLTPGARNYWKSHNFTEIRDDLIDTVTSFASELPSDQSEIFIAQVGGAQGRVAPEATAYWARDAAFVMNVHARWEAAVDDDRCRGWAREFFSAAAPFASSGAYVNFMPGDDGGRVEAAYGGNYERLLEVKRRYDPDNCFRMNHNITPAG
jgi:FAD/FMN-containing dehydrogenase